MTKSIIAVGSANRLKLLAVNQALKSMGRAEEVLAIAADSKVSEQPFGIAEVILGAANRAQEAMKVFENAALFIGIENGLRKNGGEWEDWAVVNILSQDGASVIIHSEAIVMPTSIVERAMEQGVTAGSVFAAQNVGVLADDPHAFLTEGKRNRVEILQAAIEAGLKITLGGAIMDREFHLAKIDGVVRLFPIREVAPGIKVALFNPLGDWEFGEKAGKALAEKIPSSVEVLLMPDGKAQALLHVMGRESKLPTVIARKEQKPYMKQPVIKAAVKSITTAKEQALFIGADDAEFLRNKNIVIVDDVVSTSGTLKAMKALIESVGGNLAGTMAVFTEGGARQDVICLGNLPLYNQ